MENAEQIGEASVVAGAVILDDSVIKGFTCVYCKVSILSGDVLCIYYAFYNPTERRSVCFRKLSPVRFSKFKQNNYKRGSSLTMHA